MILVVFQLKSGGFTLQIRNPINHNDNSGQLKLHSEMAECLHSSENFLYLWYKFFSTAKEELGILSKDGWFNIVQQDLLNVILDYYKLQKPAKICETQTSGNDIAVVAGHCTFFSKLLPYILTGGVKVYKLADKGRKRESRLCKRIGEIMRDGKTGQEEEEEQAKIEELPPRHSSILPL